MPKKKVGQIGQLNTEDKKMRTEHETISKSGLSKTNKIVIFIIILVILIFTYKAIDFYTGWGDMDKVIKREIESAEKHSLYKRHNTAIKIYQSLLKRISNEEKFAEQRNQIKLNLAKTYKDAEKYIEAIDMYTKLAEQYKTVNNDMYAWLLLELGDCYNNILNISDAIKTYNIVISEFPNSDWAAEAYFGIAEAYKNKRDYDNAMKYYDKIIKKYEKGFLSAEALTNKGKILESLGKYKEATAIYKKVVDDFPEIVSEYARLRLETISQQLIQK